MAYALGTKLNDFSVVLWLKQVRPPDDKKNLVTITIWLSLGLPLAGTKEKEGWSRRVN